jgi:hypothetical protein
MFDLVLNNPKYLGIAVAVLSLAGGGFLSWLFTFVYFKKGQSRRLLCYATRNTDYLGYRRADFHNLSVHYGEKQLVNPVRYTLYVWNCGNITLNNSDISKVDPLGFGQGGIEILETAPIWSTRDSTNPKLTIDASKTKLFLEFDFLDPGDGFAVQFLADRSTAERQWPDTLQSYGTIKGLNRAPFHVAARFEKSSWWSTYVALAVALFFAFSAAAIFYDAWQSGMTVTSFIKLLAAITFGLFAVGITAATFEGFRERLFVIPSILRRPNDMSDDVQLHLITQLEDSSRKIVAVSEQA